MKGKGHFGEKTRHALQGRGIKTTNHKLVAFGTVEEDNAAEIEYDKYNKQLWQNLQDLKDELTRNVDIILESKPRYVNDIEKKIIREQFGHNISTNVIICNEDEDILILPEDTNRNWRYYAGFEYIKDNPPVKLGEYFIYERNDSDRVAEILDSIHQIERQPMEEY
jgi:hypothetical protein